MILCRITPRNVCIYTSEGNVFEMDENLREIGIK